MFLYANSNAIGVNVQVYTTSNIMISIRDRLHRDLMLLDLLQQSQQFSFALIETKTNNKIDNLIN